MDRLRQVDSNQIFEPLGRCRAFTWHGNLNDYNSADQSTKQELSTVVESLNTDDQKNEILNLKKPSTRRNAWGCMSYADLITKAIESVPEKRLTLSQIYAWMIQNIPYFKDKGESNSSAGWKNSVRHNLSLHRKFVRVQNEGTGKSSWWIVNNEVKSCKSPRRRAASMDNRSYEKKKCPTTTAKQNLQERSPAASHTKSDVVSVVPEVQRLDSFATAFSPIDLRSSGKDGTLKSVLPSPMGLATELPLGDDVMKQPSPLYWNRCHNVNPSYMHPEGLVETVSESLAELFTPEMNPSYEPSFLPADRQLTVLQNISNEKYISESSYLSFQDLPSPPPYAGHPTTAGDLFTQVSAKDLLQLSSSSSQLDALSGAQYMTRTGVSAHQGLQDDIAVMSKYYAQRNEGGIAGEPCSRNSVLRQMLMQAQQQQQSGILSGYADQPMESVVKTEPTEIDAFSYRDTSPFPSETMLPAGSLLPDASNSQSSILDYRKSSAYVVIKQETDAEFLEEDRRREAWNFSSPSSDADAQRGN